MEKQQEIDKLLDLTIYNEWEQSQILSIIKWKSWQDNITSSNLSALIERATERKIYIQKIDNFIFDYMSNSLKISTKDFIRLEVLPVENWNIWITLKNKITHQYYYIIIKQSTDKIDFEIISQEIINI